MIKNKRSIWTLLLTLLCCLPLMACTDILKESGQWDAGNTKNVSSVNDIPEYAGEPYVILNENKPLFTNDELTDQSFEEYSQLDQLGRCGVAYACIGKDLMPTQKRGNISHVKPSGWHSVRYDIVEGGSLYNRSHLIAHQLAGEDANEKNLITGTRYMNADGMIPFENQVADYVKETGNHVMYRVTPVFEGDNLVADGVEMEALSVEDQGEGVCYHVFIYNVQPGISIDYATGESFREETDDAADQQHQEGEIRGNSRSGIYHCPGQAAYDEMKDSANLIIFRTEEEAVEAGYRKAKR